MMNDCFYITFHNIYYTHYFTSQQIIQIIIILKLLQTTFYPTLI